MTAYRHSDALRNAAPDHVPNGAASEIVKDQAAVAHRVFIEHRFAAHRTGHRLTVSKFYFSPTDRAYKPPESALDAGRIPSVPHIDNWFPVAVEDMRFCPLILNTCLQQYGNVARRLHKARFPALGFAP